ncbi:uncharacterized protein LOC106130325 [Amyelois transitella]|uniref:uncharacterized protein LOC106130325 n=1 Tax=Amyelois transitella TaxID=680683 RepID=UPI0029901135|nr:uncharacterized protein LOC106130325 [Amyelois transitella]
MRRTLALALLFAIVQRCVSAVNYCGAKMCGYTNAHTFCQYPAGPSPSCSGYVEAPLTLEEKVRILTRLNRRRSDVATGRLRNYPTAGDMLKLRWVEELAREAQRWADQCRPPNTPDEHDACRDLYSVSVGQNVASVVGEAPGLRVESMVDMWYMQSIHYKGNVTNYEPPMSTVNYYGDFAQIVWSYTYMVGCGRSRFMIHLKGRMRSVERLVCNFAPRGPMSGQPIWSLDEPASLCPVRSLPDSEFRGLCAYQPYIDVPNDLNNITTIEEITLLNTIFEIEINDELNYPGSMDEVYLTKIAIATLEDKAKTEAYNNNQKRDIYFLNTNMISNEFNNNVKEPDKEHLVQIKETSSQKPVQTKAKVKLIGRHKSYKTDDLIAVGGVQTTEHYPIPADIPQQKNEFYVDYQYVETNEGKSISTENIVVVSEISPITPHNTTENVMITSEVSNPLATMNVTFGYVEDINETSLKIDESMRNYNISYVTQKEEELFSDPEVVRDLELALRQMEQNMETSTITTASIGAEKVKRELREVSKDTMDRKPREYGNISPILQEINMTADKAPMLNMILKYMPYLKPYKNELLGKVTNGAKIVLPPLIVRFIVFICMFIVIYGL